MKSSIDPQLRTMTLDVSGESTIEVAVAKDPHELIARRRQKRLLDLMGRIERDRANDYKAQRSRD